MRKIFFVFFSLVCIIPSFGQRANVELSYDHTTTVSDGHPCIIPTVTSENDDVTISSDSTIYNVDIIIKDQYGQVLHQSTQTIDPTGTVVSVPNYGSDSEKTTIDLYYDRQHLCGYFEN